MSTLLLSQHWGRWRARFGVRVTSAVDLAGLAGYAELAPADRYARAHGEDIDYLNRLCGTEEDAAFEARWLATPGNEPALFLLGRLDRASRAEAEEDGARARDRLAALPEHVQGHLTEEVEQAFVPFAAHPNGVAEVRRQVTVARPARPDAPVRSYLLVSPLASAPHRWPAVLERLAARAPVMVSVTAQPTRVPPDFPALLDHIADQYAQLAQPGEFRQAGLYARPVRLPADPAAATAERRYRDAASRYSGQVVKLRVTIASPEPLDAGLAQSVADLLGGTLERPAGPHDLALLQSGLGTLEIPRWGGHPVWRSAPQSLRLLCELADHAEAAAAFWLPAAATGSLPHFPVTPPEPSRAAGRGIVFQDSDVTVFGDVIGGDQRNHPRP
jgi:hypothetical protein